MTVTVRYLGGAEAWIELKARGRTIKRPGSRALLDIVQELARRDVPLR